MIGSTLGDLEKQFTGTDSPSYRWAREIEQAQDELKALMLPASQWLPIIFAFALIIMLWSLLAALLLTLLQSFWVAPLILQAETFEKAPAATEVVHEHAAGATAHTHDAEAWEPEDGCQRSSCDQ